MIKHEIASQELEKNYMYHKYATTPEWQSPRQECRYRWIEASWVGQTLRSPHLKLAIEAHRMKQKKGGGFFTYEWIVIRDLGSSMNGYAMDRTGAQNNKISRWAPKK